jgi:phage terminase small subunit
MADKNKLTIKQEKYAQGLFSGLSQREAYKQAYNAENMKDNTIDRVAYDLANDSKVTTRLEELKNELKERNMVTADKVIAEFAHIAFDDIKNYLDYRTEKTVVGHDLITGSPIMEYRTIVDLKDSQTIDTRNIKSVSIAANGTFKFEQYCKDNALLQLAKLMGMMTDKVEAKVTADNTNLNIDYSTLSHEALDEIANAVGDQAIMAIVAKYKKT